MYQYEIMSLVQVRVQIKKSHKNSQPNQHYKIRKNGNISAKNNNYYDFILTSEQKTVYLCGHNITLFLILIYGRIYCSQYSNSF